MKSDLQRLIETMRHSGAPGITIFAHGSALLLLDAQRSQTIPDAAALLAWVESVEERKVGK